MLNVAVRLLCGAQKARLVRVILCMDGHSFKILSVASPIASRKPIQRSVGEVVFDELLKITPFSRPKQPNPEQSLQFCFVLKNI